MASRTYTDFYPYTGINTARVIISELHDLILYEYDATIESQGPFAVTYSFAQSWESYSKLCISFGWYGNDRHPRWEVEMRLEDPQEVAPSLCVRTVSEVLSLTLRHRHEAPTIVSAVNSIRGFLEARPYKMKGRDVFKPYLLTDYESRMSVVITNHLDPGMTSHLSGRNMFKVYIQGHTPPLPGEPETLEDDLFHVKVTPSNVFTLGTANFQNSRHVALFNWQRQKEHDILAEIATL